MSVQDDAIDVAASDLDAYRDGRDLRHLVLSGEPVWFSVQAIAHDEFLDLASACGLRPGHAPDARQYSALCVELFRAACVGIEGLTRTVEEMDGALTTEIVAFRQDRVPGTRYRRVADTVMSEVPLSVAVELGDAVMRISHLGDAEKKASSAPISPTTSPTTSSSTASDAPPTHT